MKISIIIPIYNVSQYVNRCLESVINQTFTNIECVLIDDCGSDDSMSKVNYFVENYRGPIVFHIIHHDKNRGLSAARNTGVKNASGDYIYFLDSDDEITNDAISTLYSFIDKYGYIDIVQGNHCKDSLKDKGYSFKNEFYTTNLIKHLFEYPCGTIAWNKLINKRLLTGNDFEDGVLHEDFLWTYYLSQKIKTICFCKKITYIYYTTPQSITHDSSLDTRNIESQQIIYREIFKDILSVKAKDIYLVRHVLDNYMFGFFLLSTFKKKTFSEFSPIVKILIKLRKTDFTTRDKIKYASIYLSFNVAKFYSKTILYGIKSLNYLRHNKIN